MTSTVTRSGAPKLDFACAPLSSGSRGPPSAWRNPRSPSIGPGLLVLLGVTHDDGEAQADRLADKVRALRVFPDAARAAMNDAARRPRGAVRLAVHALRRRAQGQPPAYVAAARPEHAEPLYERFCERLGAQRGVFGAQMAVELVNDGPVTLLLEVE